MLERKGLLAEYPVESFGVKQYLLHSLKFLSSIKVNGEEGTAKVKWVRERVAFSRVDPTSLEELLQSLRTDLPERLFHLVLQRRRLDTTGF
jgi:hypothetical protein